MLNELSIKNFAIIDELHLALGEGLNVITGETGAGKSIIIGAVSLLLGDRAASEMIRSQADTATVEAVFDVSGNERVRRKIADMGFPAEDTLIIRRIISRSGKNRVFINGQAATLSNLSSVGEMLINICGQHEHQVILNAENHIDILDEFGGLLPARDHYGLMYDDYQRIRQAIAELITLRNRREEKTEWLRFQLKEIEEIHPRENEDVALSDEKKVLLNVQKISDWADEAYDLLYGKEASIVAQLKEVQNRIREIRIIDHQFSLDETEIENTLITLQEASLALRNYAKNLFFNPERLAEIDERLERVNHLKRKHGGSLENVLKRKREMEKELEEAFSVEETLRKLEAEEKTVVGNLRQSALRLSESRKNAAKRLQDAVENEIHALNMPHALFSVRFRNPDAQDAFGPKGVDDVEFYLTANQGEEAKPLNKIASGGELSRIILALKNVLSGTGSVSSIVFDEVDNGIGGGVAEIVGRKLKAVSADHQVICITHLPQIACYGDKHIYVSKKVVKGRTVTSVEELDKERKIEEISRMLGGLNLTETTKKHAREMIHQAQSMSGKSGERTC
jgi:DNA repair protein RecN (Recombination protein N)